MRIPTKRWFSLLTATLLVLSGCASNNGLMSDTTDRSTAEAILAKLSQKISVTNAPLRVGEIDSLGASLYDQLPNIDKYPFQVEPETQVYLEVMSSTEKATISSSSPNDKWLVEMAKMYNRNNPTVNGTRVSVAIRGIASGLGTDYIVSGKHVPPVITFSNDLWTEPIESAGVPLRLVEPRLVGNVAGYVLAPTAAKEMMADYGEITVKSVANAVANNKLIFGATNPLASSAGRNQLLSLLDAFDNGSTDISAQAIDGFQKFQNNLKYTAYTTLQLQNSAVTGRLDGFIYEAQQFANTRDLKDFIFTPFGVRHDSPVYAVGDLTDTEEQILDDFMVLCKSAEAQKLATSMGFNQYDDYKPSRTSYNIPARDAQTLWKEKKSGSREVVAVFVADVSGSMNGQPMNSLQKSLLSAMPYISEDCHIGMVTFSDDVQIALPLKKFDFEHMSNFAGAVQNLAASGSTAMFDGLTVACQMIVDYQKQHPESKPIIFVLTDGETTHGLKFKETQAMLSGLGIPINAISYEGGASVLTDVANLNEAAVINADSEDVVYKLSAFFNAEL